MSLRSLFLSLAAVAVCSTASAQLSLSYLGGSDIAPSGTGQSFTASDAGTFPTSTAYLTAMTFQLPGSDLINIGTAYLDIYSDAGLSTYVGSSTNSQDWGASDFGQTKTFTFGNLALDKNTTYYAAFSSDPTAGSIVDRTILYDSSNPYAGGKLIYGGTPQTGLDANFTATFATSAVPEPSTYALLAGAAALALSAVRRRRA